MNVRLADQLNFGPSCAGMMMLQLWFSTQGEEDKVSGNEVISLVWALQQLGIQIPMASFAMEWQCSLGLWVIPN